MFRPLNWGIAGTGRISSLFADCITRTESGTVGHVLSRTQEGAEAFCKRQGGTAWSNQREMLGVDGLDALYIGTPHSEHAELAIAALSVGVPVLCEKPMTCSPAGTLAVVMCAHQNGTALIEGWMYRCHPQIDRLIELISSGTIGELKTIESHFGFRADVPPEHRLRSQKLGGGPILDIGGYPLSLAMLIAGSVDGRAHVVRGPAPRGEEARRRHGRLGAGPHVEHGDAPAPRVRRGRLRAHVRVLGSAAEAAQEHEERRAVRGGGGSFDEGRARGIARHVFFFRSHNDVERERAAVGRVDELARVRNARREAALGGEDRVRVAVAQRRRALVPAAPVVEARQRAEVALSSGFAAVDAGVLVVEVQGGAARLEDRGRARWSQRDRGGAAAREEKHD